MHVFLRMRPWIYTAVDACLLDSLVLRDFLRRSGVHSTLVIGINTKPFAAHAWVQYGSQVLNDDAEHVLQFTPIITI